MMTHIEGPIVDAFYDMSLLSWANVLEPALPLLSEDPVKETQDTKVSDDSRYVKGTENAFSNI